MENEKNFENKNEKKESFLSMRCWFFKNSLQLSESDREREREKKRFEMANQVGNLDLKIEFGI